MNTLRRTIVLLCLASAASAQIPNLTITEIPLGTPPTYTVTALAADPSGTKVWFTDSRLLQIGFIDVATRTVTKFSIQPPGGETLFVVGGSQALAFGADGNLWFPAIINLATSTPRSMIGRFSPATQAVTYFPGPDSIAVSTLSRITAGADGNVWFSDASASKIAKVTPAGTFTVINVATANGGFAGVIRGITYGPDGNIWITAGFRSIYRVSPAGGPATEFRIQGGGFRGPSAITPGPDGHLYFVQSGNTADSGNKIGRITMQGVLSEWTIPTANSFPYGLALGRDGKFYFTEQLGKKLGQFNPLTGQILESPLPNGKSPLEIVAVPSGSSASSTFDRIGGIEEIELMMNAVGDGEGDPAPQAVTITETVPEGPDVEVAINILVVPVRAGDGFEYQLEVINDTDDDIATFGEPVVLSSAIPPELEYISHQDANPSVATCKRLAAITCTVHVPLAPSKTFLGLTNVKVRLKQKGTVSIHASVTGGSDIDPTNNTDHVDLFVDTSRSEYVEPIVPEELDALELMSRGSQP